MNPFPTDEREGVLVEWLFDDVAERRTLAAIVPRNWNGASDLRLRLFQVLDQAEVAGNDIEWTGEVRTLAPGQENATKAATPLADAVSNIGAAPDAIDAGDGPHVTELIIDHDDATNPVSAGGLVVATLWRKTVGGAGRAGGTIVVPADLAFARRPRLSADGRCVDSGGRRCSLTAGVRQRRAPTGVRTRAAVSRSACYR